MHSLLEVNDLLPQPVVLSTLQLELLIDILNLSLKGGNSSIEVQILLISLFEDFLDAIDFLLSHINLVLVLLDLQPCLLSDFFLIVRIVVKLVAHVFDLFRLGRVDVCLTLDVLQTFLDL